MTSKEGFTGGGSPWTEDEKVTLRRMLELRRKPSSEVPQTNDPGVEYSRLVSTAELADGVWYRGYPGARSHEFVLALTDPTKENLHKVYGAEVDLQRKFMLVSLDFQFRSALSRKDKADLRKKGYKWIPSPEETAPPNPL